MIAGVSASPAPTPLPWPWLLTALLAAAWPRIAPALDLLRCWVLVFADLTWYGLSVVWERLRR